MRSISSRSPLFLIAAAVIIAGCNASQATPAMAPAPGGNITGAQTRDEQVAHVLDRIAFGARPGDAERVAAMGVGAWVDRQLHPESIPDTILDLVLRAVPSWTIPTKTLNDSFPQQDIYIRNIKLARGLAANAPLDLTPAESLAMRMNNARGAQMASQLQAAKVIRAQLSERQLLEVMTDFWENHFSVFSGKMPARFSLLEWDRDIIRPNALGKFRDLLGAVAHSPAMLYYLDNYTSGADSLHLSLPEYRAIQANGKRPVSRRRTGYNENYARELMELHTLGVDGGYTQQDVINVARALSGWSLDVPREGGGFIFREPQHDAEEKVVLGHTLPAGRGLEDGEDVLDIVAHHPSTARYIATKLARRFVSDSPPPALVARAAATFTRTDGDIREVLRTILTSQEFFARAAFRNKVKSPLELVVSARRALNASPDTSPRTAQVVAKLGQPYFGHQTPEGWPETADGWVNAGAMLQRMNFGQQTATAKLTVAPVEQWPPFAMLSVMPADRQVDEVVRVLLGGSISSETRAILLDVFRVPVVTDAPKPMMDNVRPAAAGLLGPPRPGLRELIGVALGSPEFQRR